MNYKSNAKLKDKLDYTESVTIKQLRVTREAVAEHERRIRQMFKQDTEQQIQQKVFNVVSQENAFGEIMSQVIEKQFEFNINDEDIKQIIDDTMTNLKNSHQRALEQAKKMYEEDTNPKKGEFKFPAFEDHPFLKWSDEQRKIFATTLIKKDLIFDELAKIWDIRVTDKEVDNWLDNFYKASNTSVREYYSDRSKYESIRKIIRDQMINREILTRFKVIWDLPRPEPKKEENKPQ